MRETKSLAQDMTANIGDTTVRIDRRESREGSTEVLRVMCRGQIL